MGALQQASDAALVEQLSRLGDAPLAGRFCPIRRHGGVAGSVGLGLICQVFSLTVVASVIAGCLLLAITYAPQPSNHDCQSRGDGGRDVLLAALIDHLLEIPSAGLTRWW